MNIHDQDTFLRGKNEGFEAGMQQGMQQGIQNVAKKMIENNIPLDVIKSSTGLSDEELAALS
jgi:predicted transposase/invertase (TIGR01784 family)